MNRLVPPAPRAQLRTQLDRMADLGIGFVTVFEHSAEAIASLLQPGS